MNEKQKEAEFLQLWKSFSSFKSQAAFSTWMYRVALNTAITMTRKPGMFVDTQKVSAVPYEIANTLEFSEDVKILYKAISQLNKVEKGIVLLWLEEKSYEEIAETIGITVKNVSVKLVRIKSKLNSLYVGALSNSLFIISASFYYYYFKYGEVRPFGIDDYLVFSIIIIIGFVLGAFAQIKHQNFQIQQLEHSLTEIDENTINELSIKNQNNRRRQLFMIYLLAIICGLLVLAFILTRIW